VLDHVVALGLAVHQDVQPQLLLQGDHAGDLVLHRLLVAGVVERAAAVGGAGAAHLRDLRERADGGGGQVRQPERPALRLGARRDGGRPLTHRGRADAVGGAGHGAGTVHGARRDLVPGEGDQLGDLLVGAGEGGGELGGQRGLGLEGVRDVLEGHGGGDGGLLRRSPGGGDAAAQLREAGGGGGQLGAPHGAALDEARDQLHGADAAQLLPGGQLAAGEVQVHGVRTGGQQRRQQVADAAVGGGDQQLRPVGAGGETAEGALQELG